jgi:hypothetical protein
MADIALSVLASSVNPNQNNSGQSLVWVKSNLIGYFFYINSAASGEDLVYIKTTDGGASWGSPVSVRTGDIGGFTVSPDKWVPDNTGTKIHIWTHEDNPADEVYYTNLDTSSDTLSASVLADTHSTSGGTAFTCFAQSKSGNFIGGFQKQGGQMQIQDSLLIQEPPGETLLISLRLALGMMITA